MKPKKSLGVPEQAFRTIMDRIQLRNELSALIATYGRNKVRTALTILVNELARKSKP